MDNSMNIGLIVTVIGIIVAIIGSIITVYYARKKPEEIGTDGGFEKLFSIIENEERKKKLKKLLDEVQKDFKIQNS